MWQGKVCLVLIALVGATGCGGHPAAEAVGAPVDESTPVSAAPQEASLPDFSTPTGAVKTLIAAAESRDVETVSQCFATSADGEFANLRSRSASAEEFADFVGFVGGASVGGQRIAITGASALVAVTFKTRDEEIRLTKTDDGWKVVGF